MNSQDGKHGDQEATSYQNTDLPVLRAGTGSLNVSSIELFGSLFCLEDLALGFPGSFGSMLFPSPALKGWAGDVFLVSTMKVMCGDWSLRPDKLPFHRL